MESYHDNANNTAGLDGNRAGGSGGEKMKALIPIEAIGKKIPLIRGHKVMIDSGLAVLYGVTAKRLNEQVKRNRDRLPEEFMFWLTEREKMEVTANCNHLKRRLIYKDIAAQGII